MHWNNLNLILKNQIKVKSTISKVHHRLQQFKLKTKIDLVFKSKKSWKTSLILKFHQKWKQLLRIKLLNFSNNTQWAKTRLKWNKNRFSIKKSYQISKSQYNLKFNKCINSNQTFLCSKWILLWASHSMYSWIIRQIKPHLWFSLKTLEYRESKRSLHKRRLNFQTQPIERQIIH